MKACEARLTDAGSSTSTCGARPALAGGSHGHAHLQASLFFPNLRRARWTPSPPRVCLLALWLGSSRTARGRGPQGWPFCDWLVSLNTVSSRFTCSVSWVGISFCKAE